MSTDSGDSSSNPSDQEVEDEENEDEVEDDDDIDEGNCLIIFVVFYLLIFLVLHTCVSLLYLEQLPKTK